MTELDFELVDLYAAERPGVDRNIIAAFVWAGKEPPYAWQIDERGFGADENKIVSLYYSKFDPNGSKAENAAIDAELED